MTTANKTTVRKNLNAFMIVSATDSAKLDKSLTSLAHDIYVRKMANFDDLVDWAKNEGAMVDAAKRTTLVRNWICEQSAFMVTCYRIRDEIAADKTDERHTKPFAIPGTSQKFTKRALNSAIGINIERSKKLLKGALACHEIVKAGGKITLRRDGELNVEPKGEDLSVMSLKQVTTAHCPKPKAATQNSDAQPVVKLETLLDLMTKQLAKQSDFAAYSTVEQEQLVTIAAHLTGMMNADKAASDAAEKRVA